MGFRFTEYIHAECFSMSRERKRKRKRQRQRETERERADATFDLVSRILCWSKREAAGERAGAGAAEVRECPAVFSVHSGQ